MTITRRILLQAAMLTISGTAFAKGRPAPKDALLYFVWPQDGTVIKGAFWCRFGLRSVAPDHVLLDDDATSHRLDGTVENGDEAVTGGFHQPPVMLPDRRLDEFALKPLDACMCAFLIELHEAAVAGNVACDDGGEPTRHPAMKNERCAHRSEPQRSVASARSW